MVDHPTTTELTLKVELRRCTTSTAMSTQITTSDPGRRAVPAFSATVRQGGRPAEVTESSPNDPSACSPDGFRALHPEASLAKSQPSVPVAESRGLPQVLPKRAQPPPHPLAGVDVKLSEKLDASRRKSAGEAVRASPTKPGPEPTTTRPATAKKSNETSSRRRSPSARSARVDARADRPRDPRGQGARVTPSSTRSRRPSTRSLATNVPDPRSSSAASGDIQATLGYGPIDPVLRDPHITEIMATDTMNLWMEREVASLKADRARFADEVQYRRVPSTRSSRPCGRRIDEYCPMVDAHLRRSPHTPWASRRSPSTAGC